MSVGRTKTTEESQAGRGPGFFSKSKKKQSNIKERKSQNLLTITKSQVQLNGLQLAQSLHYKVINAH